MSFIHFAQKTLNQNQFTKIVVKRNQFIILVSRPFDALLSEKRKRLKYTQEKIVYFQNLISEDIINLMDSIA